MPWCSPISPTIPGWSRPLARRAAPDARRDHAPPRSPEVDWVARVREASGCSRAAPSGSCPPGRRGGPGGVDDRVIVVEPGPASSAPAPTRARACAWPPSRSARAPRPSAVSSTWARAAESCPWPPPRLGAAPVIAVELDEEALPVARRHAELNHCPIHLVRAGWRTRRPAGRVRRVGLANISAPLLAERPRSSRARRAARGRSSLSGLLVEDLPFVRRVCGPLALSTCGSRANGRPSWCIAGHERPPLPRARGRPRARVTPARAPAHHARDVPACGRAALVRLFDGAGAEFEAELDSVSRQGVTARITGRAEARAESPLTVRPRRPRPCAATAWSSSSRRRQSWAWPRSGP